MIDKLDPAAGPPVQEILEHAALLVDIGRSIDYYSRWEQAARIVASSDIYGFSHRDIVLISAVLEKAGTDRVRLPGYLSVLSAQDHAQVDRLAMILAVADQLATASGQASRWWFSFRRSGIVLLLPRDVGSLEAETERRFARRFERRLRLAVAPA